MKKLLLAMLPLIAANYSYAQFNTSGTITSTTNAVGIGTTNPLSSLDVTGANTGSALSANVKINAAFLHDHIAYSGVYLGYDISNQIGIIGGATAGNPSNLAFWNYNGSGWLETMRLTSSGNLGIGTPSPLAPLHVNGNIAIAAAAGSSNTYLLFQRPSDGYTGARIGNSYGMNGYQGHLVFETNNGESTTALTERMRITATGNVGIGTNNPDAKLAVQGTIHSQVVQVDMNGWSDYVFKQSYKLAPLEEVNSYISKNHHLSEIPSATQVVKDGINLGEMNTKLLKKIEELTLYLIEEHSKNVDQQQQINDLKIQMKALLRSSKK